MVIVGVGSKTYINDLRPGLSCVSKPTKSTESWKLLDQRTLLKS